jgi:hypothetical protein
VLKVTEDDIGKLDDVSMREIVAELAQASLRVLHLPTSGVTWGGDQNAADGGIDVRIELTPSHNINGFIPRSLTGFQVKKCDLEPADIVKEMRPNGKLRQAIREIADAKGAYIIVSSGVTLSDIMLRRRRAAMIEAVSDCVAKNEIFLDFYDQRRLATWVSDHQSLIPYIRKKAGRPVSGWQSYGDWSQAGNSELIIDESSRFQNNTTMSSMAGAADLSIIAGIAHMRNALRAPGSVVRLVGLSGVGKTRIVQALFDEKIGQSALSSAAVLYTDVADEPDPVPIAIADQLVRQHERIVVVVDNCSPELHRRLSATCRGTTVSVLTVEYDIREDLPEDTCVFMLKTASPDIVAKIVLSRFGQISGVNADSIGRFSDGNARVGIALANAMSLSDSLSDIRDESLFLKLFNQRHGDNEGLLAAAEACSLVYSFQVDSDKGDSAELPFLAKLAGCTATQLFKHVAELERRGLAQKRGPWRAVLPHAIANRLAKRALQNIPQMEILNVLSIGCPQRLFKSFSRRLGFLHESSVAQSIAKKWLSIEPPSKLIEMSKDQVDILKNFTPVCPEAVLSRIEQDSEEWEEGGALENASDLRRAIIALLRQIAYDAKFFERCVSLFEKLSLPTVENTPKDEATQTFESLFLANLSGTHATIEQRNAVIKRLLDSDSDIARKLGLFALDSALQTSRFVSSHNFDFGAHTRDYGYYPGTYDDVRHWYTTIIYTIVDVGNSASAAAPLVKNVFARRLPHLWTDAPLHDLIEDATEQLSRDEFWLDGWRGACDAVWFSREWNDEPLKTRIRELRDRLAPKRLIDKIHATILEERDIFYESDGTVEGFGRACSLVATAAEALGAETIGDAEALELALPLLLSSGNGRRSDFGVGMASASLDRHALWNKMKAVIGDLGDAGNPTVLAGFMTKWKSLAETEVEDELDHAISDNRISRFLPYIHVALGLSNQGIGRLIRLADLHTIPPFEFRSLKMGRRTSEVSPGDFCRLLRSLLNQHGGDTVAMELLSTRFEAELPGDLENRGLVEIGREILCAMDLDRNDNGHSDFVIGRLASACLVGDDASAAAEVICNKLAGAIHEARISPHNYRMLLSSLFSSQTTVALDALLRGTENGHPRHSILRIFDNMSGYMKNPLAELSPETILEWCERDAIRNFPAAALSVPYATEGGDGRGHNWSELAAAILRRAPNKRSVLSNFAARFRPSMWSGSLAGHMEAVSILLTRIEEWDDAELTLLARDEREKLIREIAEERAWESTRSREEHDRFE